MKPVKLCVLCICVYYTIRSYVFVWIVHLNEMQGKLQDQLFSFFVCKKKLKPMNKTEETWSFEKEVLIIFASFLSNKKNVLSLTFFTLTASRTAYWLLEGVNEWMYLRALYHMYHSSFILRGECKFFTNSLQNWKWQTKLTLFIVELWSSHTMYRLVAKEIHLNWEPLFQQSQTIPKVLLLPHVNDATKMKCHQGINQIQSKKPLLSRNNFVIPQ